MNLSQVLQATGYDIDKLIKIAAFGRGDNELLYIKKFAKSATLTANTIEDIWSPGGTKVKLTSAETMTIASSSVNDIAGTGTGARTITIAGVDENYNLASETIEMDGTDDVISDNSYFNIHRMKVLTAGSSYSNEGNIIATQTDSTETEAEIVIGRGQSQTSFFTIPAGYTGLLVDITLNTHRAPGGTGNKSGEFNFHTFGPDGVGGFRKLTTITRGLANYGSGQASAHERMPYLVPEKQTFYLCMIPEINGTLASVEYSMLLVKDATLIAN